MREKHTKTLQVKQKPYGYYWTKYPLLIKHKSDYCSWDHMGHRIWHGSMDRSPVTGPVRHQIRIRRNEGFIVSSLILTLARIKYFKVFYAFVLLFDVTIAQNYGPWSNMYTNRGPRPNYQDTAIRANSKRSTVPKRRSFTDVQKEALKSEVMCDVFETLNESRKQSAMMADKQRALEELEERIQDCFKIIKFTLHWII